MSRRWGPVADKVNTTRVTRSEEHTSELQSRLHLVCRLLLEKKKQQRSYPNPSKHHLELVRSQRCEPRSHFAAIQSLAHVPDASQTPLQPHDQSFRRTSSRF